MLKVELMKVGNVDDFVMEILCFWCSLLLLLRSTSSSGLVDCGSCRCDSTTNKLMECEVYRKVSRNKRCSKCFDFTFSKHYRGDQECFERIFINHAIISGVAPNFTIVNYMTNESSPITVEFGENLTITNFGHFTESLLKQKVLVRHLIVEKTAKLSIYELQLFYQSFYESLRELCIHDDNLTISEDIAKPDKFELTNGSIKFFHNLLIYSNNNKINMAGDFVFRSVYDYNYIEINTTSDAPDNDMDIYFQLPSNAELFVTLHLTITCKNETYSPRHPRLIEISPEEKRYRPLIFASITYQGCKEVYFPASFLAYVKDFRSLTFANTLPTEIEWGALGTEILKMEQSQLAMDKNDSFDRTKVYSVPLLTSNLQNLWSNFECGKMTEHGASRLCAVCFMQHFGLHRINDDLDKKCSDGKTISEKQQKCLRKCPKAINYPQRVPMPDYKDYVICSSGENLSLYCNPSVTASTLTSFAITTVPVTVTTSPYNSRTSIESTSSSTSGDVKVIKPTINSEKQTPWLRIVAGVCLSMFLLHNVFVIAQHSDSGSDSESSDEEEQVTEPKNTEELKNVEEHKHVEKSNYTTDSKQSTDCKDVSEPKHLSEPKNEPECENATASKYVAQLKNLKEPK